MRYLAYLEVQDDGTTMAHVPELPGCISTGLTAEVAVARLPEAIRSYLDWLRRHGEEIPAENEAIQVEIAAIEHDAYPGPANDPDGQFALFPADRWPLNEVNVARMLRLMSYSRKDMLEMVVGLTPEVLNWQPASPPGQEAWTIEDIVEHVARAERFLTSRLTASPLEMLEEARKAAAEKLAGLNEAQLNQVIEHQGEYWTASKVFRRILEHEREHTRHVEQILDRLRSSQGLV